MKLRQVAALLLFLGSARKLPGSRPPTGGHRQEEIVHRLAQFASLVPFSALAGAGLDVAIDAIVADEPVLDDRHADLAKGLLQPPAEKLAIGGSSRGGVSTERERRRVRLELPALFRPDAKPNVRGKPPSTCLD
jgi:hypothetical protein